jgi:hypothetical protein
MTTQSLTFVGETATSVGDAYAGFRVGRTTNCKWRGVTTVPWPL